MNDLLNVVIIALACPLVLPFLIGEGEEEE